MRFHTLSLVTLAAAVCAAAPASAQRVPFERSFDISHPATLNVSTDRGKIDITVGAPGRIVVSGAVTIRIDSPANAVDLASRVADHPPITRDGDTIRLRPPSDPAERRAVTVNYQVQVPPDTEIVSVSESGATTVDGVTGTVSVRTQSGAIVLTRLGARTTVATGSGSVTIDGIGGALDVTTSSSGITARGLTGDLHVRTSSGDVEAALTGTGAVDVQTGSSRVRLTGVKSALKAVSKSGTIRVQGGPGAPWEVSTGSSSVHLEMDPSAHFNVDAVTKSSSVRVEGVAVQGSVAKRAVKGTVGGGGPLVHVVTRSGSIDITIARP